MIEWRASSTTWCPWPSSKRIVHVLKVRTADGCNIWRGITSRLLTIWEYMHRADIEMHNPCSFNKSGEGQRHTESYSCRVSMLHLPLSSSPGGSYCRAVTAELHMKQLLNLWSFQPDTLKQTLILTIQENGLEKPLWRPTQVDSTISYNRTGDPESTACPAASRDEGQPHSGQERSSSSGEHYAFLFGTFEAT